MGSRALEKGENENPVASALAYGGGYRLLWKLLKMSYSNRSKALCALELGEDLLDVTNE